MEWKDITSHSRDDKERIPNTWDTKAGNLRITITRGHIYHRGSPEPWVVHCRPWFDTHPLKGIKADDIEGAQTKALAMARNQVGLAWLALNPAPTEHVAEPPPAPSQSEQKGIQIEDSTNS